MNGYIAVYHVEGERCPKLAPLIDRIPCKECGHGCGTRIYKNHELNIWQEEWSNIVHDKRRCWAIKEKQQRDKNKDSKAPRMEVVEDMIDILLKFDYDISLEHKAYHVMKSRKTKDAAVSMDEIALALHPEKVYVDKNKNKRPTPEARTSALGAVYRARMNPDNRNLAVFGYKSAVNRVFYYFNMQTKDDWRETKNRKKRDIDTRTETLMRFDEMIVKTGTKQREIEEKQYDIIMNEKRRRRRNEDANYGGYL